MTFYYYYNYYFILFRFWIFAYRHSYSNFLLLTFVLFPIFLILLTKIIIQYVGEGKTGVDCLEEKHILIWEVSDIF